MAKPIHCSLCDGEAGIHCGRCDWLKCLTCGATRDVKGKWVRHDPKA